MDFKKLGVQSAKQADEITAGNYVGGNANGNIAGRDINIFYGKHEDKQARIHTEKYLNRLMQDCADLEWLELVQLQEKQDKSQQIKLDYVYIPLLTTSVNEKNEDDWGNKQPFSAVEMLDAEQKLVMTGAPGSGKSALVNFVALCLAGEIVGDAHCNIKLLMQALPNEKGEQEGEQQTWRQGALIPLRVILRDFVSSTFFPKQNDASNAVQLLDFIKGDLKDKGLESCFASLELALAERQVLVMFDGLDEVPQAGEKRERMKRCMEEFCRSHSGNRFLVTVRPYAYEKSEWKLAGFKETELAKFNRGQISLFINDWYQPHNCPELEAADAERRAARLKQAIFGNDALEELAERPLLLTLIAFLHRNRHELPDRRADLYERLLELLIEKWEKARFKADDVDKAMELEQKSLAQYLQVGFDSIRKVLERLAFKAHAEQDSDDKDTADISAKDLSYELFRLAEEHNSNAKEDINPVTISEYLRDRVGILFQRGGNSEMDAVYSFPHRSFQEYLAASYFSRGEDALYGYHEEADNWFEIAAFLGGQDYDRWREVVVLAGGIHAGKEAMAFLLKALLEGIELGRALTVPQARGLQLAGEILAENIEQAADSRAVKKCRERLQQLLPKLLLSDCLNAKQRVTSGRHLGKIGDVRPEIMEVDAMQFCLVPKGEFHLGSDDSDSMAYSDEKQNAGLINLDYAYTMARYPVTVAQYRQFVRATNHQPANDNCLKGLDNEPVVYVTWNEAIKFCDWLTEHWQDKGYLPQGWCVDLPSEPEWEKAAKGGLQIPEKRLVASVEELSGLMTASPSRTGSLAGSFELMDNPLPKRLYPWGDEIDGEKVNYAMRVNGVSTPACYPSGKSPYGCEDMAGNVWEWTRSAYADSYPANQGEWQQRNARKQASVRRVLRGGAFNLNDGDVRCAARHHFNPVFRGSHLGVRVVVLSPYL